MLNKNYRFSFILGGVLLLLSFFLNWLVFKKTAPNFPVILRINDFGINFLVNRIFLWQPLLVGGIFIICNSFLGFFLQKQHKALSNLLFFVNIGIGFLLLLISLQIYLLNR